MRFKKTRRSPTSTNHSLNARSPLGNDECSFAVRARRSRLGEIDIDLLRAHFWITSAFPTIRLRIPDSRATVDCQICAG
jgi:hypothetical protein